MQVYRCSNVGTLNENSTMINLSSIKSLLITFILSSCIVALSYAQTTPVRSQHFKAKESISTFKELRGKTFIKSYDLELKETSCIYVGVTAYWFLDATMYEVSPCKFVAYLDSNEEGFYKVEILKDSKGGIKSITMFTAKDIFITYK
jgi:hypothetical protein